MNTVFKETGPADRALLVATIFLSGSEAVATQDASRRLLGKGPQNDVEAILTGPDLSTRLRAVGAEVDGRHATFDHKPGYAQAVLNHLWQQRPDIHMHLLKWLDTITAPGEPGASRLAVISDLLVELAITENDVRIIDQIRTWIGNGNTTTQHEALIAGVFTRAALADALGAKVRTKLLDWAQSDEERVAKVVALVCQGEFATHYPRQTSCACGTSSTARNRIPPYEQRRRPCVPWPSSQASCPGCGKQSSSGPHSMVTWPATAPSSPCSTRRTTHTSFRC